MAGGASGEDTAIVRSTADLAHNLGLNVVAEGVEDQWTLDLLGHLRLRPGAGLPHRAADAGGRRSPSWLGDSVVEGARELRPRRLLRDRLVLVVARVRLVRLGGRLRIASRTRDWWSTSSSRSSWKSLFTSGSARWGMACTKNSWAFVSERERHLHRLARRHEGPRLVVVGGLDVPQHRALHPARGVAEERGAAARAARRRASARSSPWSRRTSPPPACGASPSGPRTRGSAPAPPPRRGWRGRARPAG